MLVLRERQLPFSLKVGTHCGICCGEVKWDKPLRLHAQDPRCGTLRKLVYGDARLRILVHFYVIAGTVCKISRRNVTLKVEVFLFLLHDALSQTSGICFATCYSARFCLSTDHFSHKNGRVTRGTCRCNMSPIFCRP